MEESTAESTAATADALRMELKKTIAEILDDGGVSEDRGETDGSSRVLKAIDEAVRMLNLLREVESKLPDSDTSSSSPTSLPEVPKEFKCMLSHAIMSEPVVIASGQTYERRYIQQWLMCKVTCPKTREVLSHRLWSPNYLVAELIAQWCQANKYDRPEPSDKPIGLFNDDIDLLLQRISSPSSVEDQTKAANELRRQTKRFDNVPASFVAEIPESITRLLTPLSALGEDIDSNPGFQKDIITALLYISGLEENKTAVAQHPLVIPLLTKSLKQGTAKTRRNSAEALWLLSKLDSNKTIIGNSDTLKALVHVIKEDHFTAAISASYAVFHLCCLPENREKVVSEGLIPALINRIKERSYVYVYFALLALMTAQNGVIEEIEDLGFVDGMFSILRNTSCSVTGENGTLIFRRMCGLNTGDRDRERTRLKLIKEEEDKYSTFSKLAKQGSQRAMMEAEAILQWIKRSGTEATAGMTWQRRKQQAEIDVFSPAIQAPLLLTHLPIWSRYSIRRRPRRPPAPEMVRSATVRLPPLSSRSPELPPFPPPVTILLLPPNLIRDSSLLMVAKRALEFGSEFGNEPELFVQLKPCTICTCSGEDQVSGVETFTGKISTISTTSLVSSQLTSSSLALTKRSQERPSQDTETEKEDLWRVSSFFFSVTEIVLGLNCPPRKLRSFGLPSAMRRWPMANLLSFTCTMANLRRCGGGLMEDAEKFLALMIEKFTLWDTL
ncbi:unnamed protein product [Brassica napus]|uniref:RING-type E3 ubiquitin transferase n=1 Tax=Brassica napus TaxID=3708 RepID=A0A816UY35_BRANA|nr:unnamed protein product [Brassica napus]